MGEALKPRDIGNDFETVEDSAEAEFVHDGTRFWLKNLEGEWIHMPERSFRRYLVGEGHRVNPEDDEALSEVDKILANVELNFRVKWAGPLAGWHSGFKNIGGNNVLVTEDPKLIEPVEAPDDAPRLDNPDTFGDSRGWPVLGEFFRNLLSCETEGDAQLYCFFSYVKHTVDCLHGRYWSPSPTFAIAGEIECGKSLLCEIVRELFAKKVAQPYDWMVGLDSFNGDVLEAVLLQIDDEVSDTNPKSRARLGERLKKMCANPYQRIRGIQKEGIALQPLWRPFLCVNDTPDKLMVLPQIEKDNRDKIILLKGFAKPMPMPAQTPEERDLFWRTIVAELPHFVWWLRNEYEIPRHWQSRFGVRAYHHPAVLRSLGELSSEMQIWYFLEKTLWSGGSNLVRLHPVTGDELGPREWMGKIGDLYGFLTDTRQDDSARIKLTPAEASKVPQGGWLGQRLTALQEIYPDNLKYVKHRTGRYWHIIPPKEFLEGAGDDAEDMEGDL